MYEHDYCRQVQPSLPSCTCPVGRPYVRQSGLIPSPSKTDEHSNATSKPALSFTRRFFPFSSECFLYDATADYEVKINKSIHSRRSSTLLPCAFRRMSLLAALTATPGTKADYFPTVVYAHLTYCKLGDLLPSSFSINVFILPFRVSLHLAPIYLAHLDSALAVI